MTLGGYVAWLRVGAAPTPDANQAARTDRLASALARPRGADTVAPPRAGDVVAVVRIPALGRTWAYPVYEGTDDAELSKGLAHYPGTAGPGGVGNFAIAGHRSSITGFEPFADLPDLVHPGDVITVTARGGVFTYTVTATQNVSPSAVQVLAPDQGRGADPAQRLITLTTCTPRFGHTGRYVVFGRLESLHG
ncbi:sortase [Streptacidiphilus pinicola]|uniref:sortase n=1 Tax=Streptacidiphilus pinicola TaxID=2219663 RepID=UPI001403E537|nr:sortase [Streptacidiphilus pinicola]